MKILIEGSALAAKVPGGIQRCVDTYLRFFSENRVGDIVALSYLPIEGYPRINTLIFRVVASRFLPKKILLHFYAKKIFHHIKSLRHPAVYWNISGFVPIPTSGKMLVISTLYDLAMIKNRFGPHGAPMKLRLERLWFRRIFYRACRYSDFIFVPTSATKKDIVDTFKIDEDKMRVVPCPVDLRSFSEARSDATDQFLHRHNLQSKRYILYCNTIQAKRGVRILVRAFLQLKREGELEGIQLVIAGSDWLAEAKEIIDEIKALNHRDIIVIPNPHDRDVPKLYSGALAYVYPSLYEGFGYTPLEAMACGAPVIISDDPAMVEVSGRAALVCRRGDAEDLASKIQLLVSTPALQHELMMRGRAVVKEYDAQRISEKTLALIHELAREKLGWV